jgi:hypothetical protein
VFLEDRLSRQGVVLLQRQHAGSTGGGATAAAGGQVLGWGPAAPRIHPLQLLQQAPGAPAALQPLAAAAAFGGGNVANGVSAAAASDAAATGAAAGTSGFGSGLHSHGYHDGITAELEAAVAAEEGWTAAAAAAAGAASIAPSDSLPPVAFGQSEPALPLSGGAVAGTNAAGSEGLMLAQQEQEQEAEDHGGEWQQRQQGAADSERAHMARVLEARGLGRASAAAAAAASAAYAQHAAAAGGAAGAASAAPGFAAAAVSAAASRGNLPKPRRVMALTPELSATSAAASAAAVALERTSQQAQQLVGQPILQPFDSEELALGQGLAAAFAPVDAGEAPSAGTGLNDSQWGGDVGSLSSSPASPVAGPGNTPPSPSYAASDSSSSVGQGQVYEEDHRLERRSGRRRGRGNGRAGHKLSGGDGSAAEIPMSQKHCGTAGWGGEEDSGGDRELPGAAPEYAGALADGLPPAAAPPQHGAAPEDDEGAAGWAADFIADYHEMAAAASCGPPPAAADEEAAAAPRGP